MMSSLLVLQTILLLCAPLTTGQATRRLTISTLLQPPYVMVDDENTGSGNATYKGFINDLMELLGDRLKFKYELVPVIDQMFGTLLPNGTWTGAVGQVVSANANMAAGPITVTSNRAKFVDFSQPFQFTGPVIVMRRPDEKMPPFKDRLLHILKPFRNDVWLLSCLAYLITGSIVYIISYCNPYEWRRMSRDGEATIREGESFTCLNSFWFTISAVFLQGFTRSPRSTGARIVVITWWFFVIVFFASYVGNLSNLLRVGPRPSAIETYAKVRSFNDLALNEEIIVHVVKGEATQANIMNSKITEHQTLATKISKNKESLVNTIGEGIQLVMESAPGTRAVIIESAMAKYYTEQAGCQLYFVNDLLLTTQYGLVLPLNSSDMKAVNQALLTLSENGELRRLEAKWFRGHCNKYMLEKSEDEKFEIPHFYPLDLGSFSGALFILAIGLVLGGLVTLLEIVIFKYAESAEDPVKTKPRPLQQRSVDRSSDPGANQSLLQPPGASSDQQRDMTAV
ncbi:glutamate receptor U1-like [Mizuhopecten yessoensis]|uniref:Glutamate receptor 2 n=1 Tax=Mizuhopecten yessoensis TaxID=6573 RepID=A0A210PVX5_MIZYE|nr:glutamate receptor U1-like [Mizuhopecten yessoensis]OWF40647.1 Glutamate receptor 2 [Mizuhopecten yessoensis]